MIYEEMYIKDIKSSKDIKSFIKNISKKNENIYIKIEDEYTENPVIHTVDNLFDRLDICFNVVILYKNNGFVCCFKRDIATKYYSVVEMSDFIYNIIQRDYQLGG